MKYQSYELAHTLLRPWRAQSRLPAAGLLAPAQPGRLHLGRPQGRGGLRGVRERDAPLRQARLGSDRRPPSSASRCRSRSRSSVDPFLRSAPLRPRRGGGRQALRSQGADRGTDVRALRHAAARHRRGDDPRAQSLRHRLARRARDPGLDGRFDLDDFIDHVIDFVRYIGTNTHVIAVCQPSVPVLAAAARMAAMDDPCRPASITLMGGPIDTRRNPTKVNQLAQSRSIEWFEQQRDRARALAERGFLRRVYPGFIQLTGFMQMNLDRHVEAHKTLYAQPGQGRLQLGPAASAPSTRSIWRSWTCRPSSTCRPSRPCSSATPCPTAS